MVKRTAANCPFRPPRGRAAALQLQLHEHTKLINSALVAEMLCDARKFGFTRALHGVVWYGG
jgi:hypothetical protein